MIQITLNGWISEETWRVALVFARVGAALMMLPGYGEPGIPARFRLFVGLGFAVAIAATIGPVPPPPKNVWGLIFGLLPDLSTGILFGLLSRTIVSGMLTAGTVIGQNIGMANIFIQGLGFEQSAALGSITYAAFLAALFASHGDHLILRAMVGTYDIVAPGNWLDISASAKAMVDATAKSFELAVQLSMPFLLLALLFNVSLAMVNKVMPHLPVFQIGQPFLLALGLYLLAASAPAMLEHSLSAYTDILMVMR
jgi:flagellar biosynthetic protein FliR